MRDYYYVQPRHSITCNGPRRCLITETERKRRKLSPKVKTIIKYVHEKVQQPPPKVQTPAPPVLPKIELPDLPKTKDYSGHLRALEEEQMRINRRLKEQFEYEMKVLVQQSEQDIEEERLLTRQIIE